MIPFHHLVSFLLAFEFKFLLKYLYYSFLAFYKNIAM